MAEYLLLASWTVIDAIAALGRREADFAAGHALQDPLVG